MPDRFTAEELRALAKDRPGVIGPMLLQAADTEEMIEKIASADIELACDVWAKMPDGFDHIGEGDILQVLRALAAVLKGEATNG